MVVQEEMEAIVVVIVNHVTKTSIGAVVAIANGMIVMAVAMVIDPKDKIMNINEVKKDLDEFHFGCLKIEGFDDDLSISITLFFNHLN